MFGNEINDFLELMDGRASVKIVRGSGKAKENKAANGTVFDALNRFLFPGKKDQFISNKPLFETFPETVVNAGGLGGVQAILKMVMAAFGNTNPNPIFRMALSNWAMGVLTQAASMIEEVLQNEVLKKSPLGSIAQTLSGIVKNLIGMTKDSFEGHKNTIASNKELGKSFNDVGRMA